MAAAADELLLLERVFLRIGSAETDEQLENAVSKFLPPVLLKLSSQQEGVRKKVMELLVHINKRIKSRSLVQLPVEALLLQYQDPAASSFVINFTIIYIKLGFPRLPLEKQCELLPSILSAIEGKPQPHQDSLLMLTIPLLGQITMPTDPEKRKFLFGLNEKQNVAKQLLSVMLDMLLLPYGATAQAQSLDGSSTTDSTSAANTFPTPSGMSPYSFKRVTTGSDGSNQSFRPEQLEQIKLGIVRFLAAGVFPDTEILVHLIVAAADTRFSVANLADLELKKIVGGLNWGNATLLSPVYRLYLGTMGNVKPEHKKLPASIRIRLKLMQYLCRATNNALVLPPCIQIIFDSLYGNNTNAKLKSLTLTFTTNIIQQTDKAALETVGRVLLCGLMKLIEDGDGPHQAQAYTVLGLLGRRLPNLVNTNLVILEKLFKKLISETPDVKLNVREGLLHLVEAYQETAKDAAAETHLSELMNLLRQYVDDTEPMVRFVAIKYIAVVFPPNHVESKFLLLLALGDSKDDVNVEAKKSLFGSTFNQSKTTVEIQTKKVELPTFNNLMKFIYKEANLRLQKPTKCYTQGNHLLPFTTVVYKEMLMYLRMCLLSNIDLPYTNEAMIHPNKWTPTIAKYLNDIYDFNDIEIEKNSIVQYIFFAKKLLKVQPSVETLCCIIEIVGCIPSTYKFLFEDLKLLRDLLNSTREEIREYDAILYGIVVANGLNNDEYNNTLNELLRNTENNKYLETQHGCILGTANALERRIVLGASPEKVETIYGKCIKILLNFLKSETTLLLGGSCVALGLLGNCGALPLNEDQKLEVVNILLTIMKNAKLTSRIRECSIRSLGRISCGDNQFPHVRHTLQRLLENVCEFRDLELQLAAGDTLVLCVNPQPTLDQWTTILVTEDTESNDRDEHLEFIADQLLITITQPQPHGKQTSAVWLLALLRGCSNRNVLKSRMQLIQKAFMDLLSENNEIVVDIASKALGIIYDKSETTLGNALLEELVSQLQGGRRTVPQVTGETRIFEDGEVGRAPDGGRLNTYRELCSLASDLNKPDLIYKFMQLANHNTIWNSRKGAGFGFAAVAEKAGEQLKPYLPQIVPRLYRYQFDPQPQIQLPMQRLWQSLVTDTSRTVIENKDAILEDLVQHLTANEWRVRHSSCAALSDFFRLMGSRGILNCVELWPKIWTGLFRVMDDVHENTRLAANSTALQLSKLCVRSCDPMYHSSDNSAKLLQALLSVFLEHGIVDSVEEVRAISLMTVAQLVDSAGSQLRPHLPLLIPALLQATGELESSKLSYVSTMFSSNTNTQEIIDTVRASAAKSHYTTETVIKCLQYIDADTLESLLPRVIDLMKSSPRLGSRVACAHFLSLLAVHHAAHLTPHAGRILTVLLNGLTDRNTTVRKYYAVALGHLVAVAKESSAEKVMIKLKTWYFEREDSGTRAACAYAMQAIANHAPEALKTNESIAMPLIFFAMHAEKTQENERVIEIWNEIWSENTAGTEAGIRQNIEIICSTLKTALESPSWTMKAQAANAIAVVAEKFGTHLEPQYRNSLLNILVSGLTGRIWDGKEKLLNALACLCRNCSEAVKTDPEIKVELIIDSLIKECKKDNLIYKRTALEATGDVLSSLDVDRFEELYNIVQNILEKDTFDFENEELSGEELSKNREQIIKLLETIYQTLGKAWPTNNETQEKYGELFVIHCVQCLPKRTRIVQVSVITALCQYVDKLAVLHLDSVSQANEQKFPNILRHVVEAAAYALNISKHTRLRKEALNVLLSVTRGIKDKQRTSDFEYLKEELNKILPEIENDQQPEIKSRLIDLKQLF